MGSWSSLLVAYLVGGITFIPLLVLSVLAHAYYTFPDRSEAGSSPGRLQRERDEQDAIVQPGDDISALEAVKKDDAKAQRQDTGVFAGYFAVHRDYNPLGINAKPVERSTPPGTTPLAAPSPSVYQTMYRSLFERKPANAQQETTPPSSRPGKAGHVFYIVLRHGHLMLFDDEEQLEVRHVISLAHHDIDIYSGGDVTPEGELFIKRNALRLKRKSDTRDIAPDQQPSKPFYLFSENCSEKEDFYFALLRNQRQTFVETDAPQPQSFEVKNIISLVQKLHSSEDQVHSRWLNALLGRIFLGVYKTKDIESLIREKITKKISRVKTPSFLTNIALKDMDMGEAAPLFSNFRLKDLSVEGECVVEADVKYTGKFRGEVAATAKLDLGPRFKSREVNLVLAVVLQRLEGHMLFKIKAPPSNRVWLSFQTMPKLEMAIEPVVSSRQITYTLILRQIESRIKEVFAETLVQPFWDDMPFFKTEHKRWRGGIFEGDDRVETSLDTEEMAAKDGNIEKVEEMEEMEGPSKPVEKSHSLPVIDSQQQESAGLFGRKYKGRKDSLTSTSSTVARDSKAADSTPPSPNLIRSTPEAVVGTVATHAETYRPSSSPPDQASNFMAALHSREQDRSPAVSPIGSLSDAPTKLGSSGSSVSSKEVADSADRDDRAPGSGRRNTASSAGSGSTLDYDTQSMHSLKESLRDQAGNLGRSLFAHRENSSTSLGSTAPSQNSDHAKRNTLAAVTNAAKQAQQWGWNAIQKQREAKKGADSSAQMDLTQPMGGGQPLPPPGTPLPRPLSGATKIGPASSQTLKRKPVAATAPTLPERPATAEGRDQHPEDTRAVPPPLPQRRRRGGSCDQEVDEEPGMLVVTMPSDSEPGTPLTEHTPQPRASPPRSSQREYDGQDEVTHRPASEILTRDDQPIVAVPADGSGEDEDDGYEGWMQNDEAPESEDPAEADKGPAAKHTATTAV